MSGYDVTRLTAAGPVTEHYDGKIETDGPWLIAHGANPDLPELVVPAHAVVAAQPCRGGCDPDGK